MVFSRFASPHVNIRLDSRPVSGSVVLPGQDPSEGALLLTTGNKVSRGHRSQVSWNQIGFHWERNYLLVSVLDHKGSSDWPWLRSPDHLHLLLDVVAGDRMWLV